MDKIAIISDIHGNYEALTTVLKDIENRNIKNIYCLGDIIAKGVHPSECLTLIKDLLIKLIDTLYETFKIRN